MIIDTHCHLTHERFSDDLDAVIAQARAVDVGHAMLIGTGVDDGISGAELARQHPDFFSTACGVDPFTCHELWDLFDEEMARLEQHLRAAGCKALGECGLEYFHDVLPKSDQKRAFEAQLDLAFKLDLPVVIHTRDAHEDMLAILADHPANRGVIHSFDGTAAHAAAYLERGWHLSFNGMVTFKKKDYLREAAAIVPADRILVETDSPYLAPVPVRGRRCEPAFTSHTLQHLATLRSVAVSDLAAETTANAVALFDYQLSPSAASPTATGR
jgi:TatD DNase family protein